MRGQASSAPAPGPSGSGSSANGTNPASFAPSNHGDLSVSEAALRNNAAVVDYCRTFMAALAGSTAGLLGLNGLNGFGFYVFAVLSLWIMLLMKAGVNFHNYFLSRKSLLTNGFFGALFTYILFWTFIYGMVHVY